ncbi:ADP-ribosylation factor-like protein 6-interacting protein 6 [Engraulis encrasicolus]|uniref:ADP-ribosylation factor-like protein 6-interacting protein 6 n=1 Tax=Engraulis encrasicolus TaxID=184585 RepID=UPI002FD0AAF6
MPRVDNAATTDGVRLATEPLARRLTFTQESPKDSGIELREVDGTNFQTASFHETSHQGVPINTKPGGQQNQCCEQHWTARILAILLCVIVASAIALVFAFVYIILKELKTEKIMKEDGTEVKLLGFWSMLIISSLAGVACCSFSWTMTYFDSYDPAIRSPPSATGLRRLTGHSFHMGYSVAILNGIVAAFTVIWCLT